MPHQCTTCGRVFPDGSKEMLSGCPECGGTAFQFHPKGTDIPPEPPDVSPNADDERTDSPDRDGAGGRPSRTPASDSPAGPVAEDAAGGEDDGIIVAGGAEREGAEDAAQSSARSDPAPTEDLLADGEASSPRADRTDERSGQAAGVDDPVAMADRQPPSDGRVVSTPAGEQPDIEELRERLTDQFESIKIVEPGKYELNLMELYDREEYVIALQENGRYVIQVPETWLGEGAEDD